jgi:hypothetical protein
MLPAIDDLHGKELAFATYAARLHDKDTGAVDEAMAGEFAAASAGYSRAINDALKAYAGIDYAVEPSAKTRAKACINYAYDFLALLMDIIKVMDLDPPAVKEVARRFDLLEDFLLQKGSLVGSTYLDAAKHELAAFHDPSVREKLEEKLARMIKERTGS